MQPSSPTRTAATDSIRFRPLPFLRMVLIVGAGFTLLSFSMSALDPRWATVHGWMHAAGTSLGFAVLIQGTIAALFAGAQRLLGPRIARFEGWQRWAFYWGIPTFGTAIALPVAIVLLAPDEPDTATRMQTTPLGAAVFLLIVTLLFLAFFTLRARQLRAERHASEAQLRLLQAQMEPHFLFNTLANVLGLMEADMPRAKAMLESFTDYLRASLVSLRSPEHALGTELDLIDAYLRVAQARMDDRLRFRFEVDDVLRAWSVPALSLQPLVENAVVHGLEPSIAGGTVLVRAHREGERLVVSVTDDGLGRRHAHRVPGSGTALVNIRQRLAQAHGRAASLELFDVEPHGVRAVLTVPALPAVLPERPRP